MGEKRLEASISSKQEDKLKKISMELIGKVNKTLAVRILINQYRLEDEK